MGLTRILAVYCTGPMMVWVEMEAEGALLELFPHEAEGEVKAGREKSHAHWVLSAFAPAWLTPAHGVNSSSGQMVLLSGTCGHLCVQPLPSPLCIPTASCCPPGGPRAGTRDLKPGLSSSGASKGETEGHVCYSTWFALRSITAACSGCLAPGVGCLFSEVDV